MNKASRWMMRYFGVGLLMLLVGGCVGTITKEGLDEKGMEKAAARDPDQTYYVGSQGKYDYFVIRNSAGGMAHHYRVRESEEAVTGRFGRTANESLWRVYGRELVVTNR